MKNDKIKKVFVSGCYDMLHSGGKVKKVKSKK